MNSIIVMTRKQLYTEIWELSVAGVARKYNLNYSRLIKQCREENIPFPASGYWTRKNIGKDVSSEVILLSGDPDKKLSILAKDAIVARPKKEVGTEKNNKQNDYTSNVVMEGQRPAEAIEIDNIQKIDTVERTQCSDTKIPDDFLSFLEKEDRIKVWNTIQTIQINDNVRLHQRLVQYKKHVAEYKEQLKKAQSKPYYNPSRDKPKDEPEVFKETSDEGMNRALVILDALFRAIEQLGGKVNEDLSVVVNQDAVHIRFAEGQDKVKHELTKQEANALVKYNDEIKRNHWASKPKIRQYDYYYNGKMRIIMDGNYIRESASKPLEMSLGDMLICIYKKSEEHRIAREQREERERIWQEEKRREKEQKERKAKEFEKTIQLENLAEDYRIARDIRAFIQAKTVAGKASAEWIEWANAKADWYDPTLDVQDELLGKREHEKSKEEKRKIMEQNNRYWGWY